MCICTQQPHSVIFLSKIKVFVYVCTYKLCGDSIRMRSTYTVVIEDRRDSPQDRSTFSCQPQVRCRLTEIQRGPELDPRKLHRCKRCTQCAEITHSATQTRVLFCIQQTLVITIEHRHKPCKCEYC